MAGNEDLPPLQLPNLQAAGIAAAAAAAAAQAFAQPAAAPVADAAQALAAAGIDLSVITTIMAQNQEALKRCEQLEKQLSMQQLQLDAHQAEMDTSEFDTVAGLTEPPLKAQHKIFKALHNDSKMALYFAKQIQLHMPGAAEPTKLVMHLERHTRVMHLWYGSLKAGVQAGPDIIAPALTEYYFENLLPMALDPDSKWEPQGKKRFRDVHSDRVSEVSGRAKRGGGPWWGWTLSGCRASAASQGPPCPSCR